MIPTEVRDELDGSMRWWDRQFAALHASAFVAKPFVEDEHLGHSWIEERYFGGRVERHCTDCPTVWVPRD